MDNRYTTQSYWENYYGNNRVDRRSIELMGKNYDGLWEQMIDACKSPPKNIIEIGTYPGRYLAYLAAKYELKPFGIDFNPDKEKVAASMHTMGISQYTYYQADFFEFQPPQQYDLVVSIGFIEHFENFQEVLDRHATYLRPGGAMTVMIPNKRFLRKWYGYLCDHENLKKHNLKCMDLQTFKSFAQRNKLKIEYLSYHGGFAYKVHQPLNLFQKIIFKTVRYLSLKLEKSLAVNPSKYWSGTIIAILSK